MPMSVKPSSSKNLSARILFHIFIPWLFTLPIAAQDSGNFFNQSQARAAATQAEQPHWVTPLFTTTPRLEQELRYDFLWPETSDGTRMMNIGGGKGLEFIPYDRIQITFNPPPYLIHNSATARDGLADVAFLMKYRILSRNEKKGNYILTFFLGGSLPTGSYKNGAADASITPTIAAGKGWGDFDVQSTFGANLPVKNSVAAGQPILWNTAVKYKIFKRISPEVEVNSTFFPNGPNQGKKQAFLSPGILFGRFPIHNRMAFTFGAGIQIATTHYHTTNHNVILSMRMPF